MRIKKITLKNIRSYENQEIVFPQGSLLLSGEIGSGKTSILLAIEYALFGLQPGQKGSALLRNNSDEGFVSIELESDGNAILIERKLKRSNKAVTNEYAAISINGNKFESSITEVKTKILEVLSYPPEFIKKNNLLYRYTVYTPQEQMKQIILEDPESRLNIIRHIFGIDKYKIIRENISIIVSYLKEESKSIQGEIKTIEEDKLKLESYKNLFNTNMLKINQKSLLLKEKIEDVKKVESDISTLENKIKEKEFFEKELEKTQVFILTKRDTISTLKREFNELQKNLSTEEVFNDVELTAVINKINESEKLIESLNSKHTSINSQILSLEQLKNENIIKKDRVFKINLCPTCLQNVPHTHKTNILIETESSINKALAQIKSLEVEKSTIPSLIELEKLKKKSLDLEKTRLEILKSKISYLEKSRLKLVEVQKTIDSLEKDLSLLEKHRTDLKESILSMSSISPVYNKKKEELKKAQSDEKLVEISIAELKRENHLAQNEILTLNSTIEKKENAKKKLANLLELNDWISTQFLHLVEFTEKNVLMRLRLEFAKLFSKWFALLVSSDLITVHLDDSFTPIIVHGESEIEYSFLSGGERTAVALAYRLALNQTLNSMLSKIKTKDIVILDEPTEGFSETQISKIRDILLELNITQLIIVSHEQKIESFVSSIIKVTKEGNTSTVENTQDRKISSL